MLGQFSRKHKTDSRLDFSAAQSGLLVVGGKLSGLGSDSLKDIIDERVHDAHSLLGDSCIGVDLLQNLVDIRRVALGTLLAALGAAGGLLGWCCLLGGLLGGCLGHLVCCFLNNACVKLCERLR